MQRFASFVCSMAVLITVQAAMAQDDFKPIFDGKTLDGWDGNPKFWSVQDGCITGETTAANPTQGNTFLIWRGGQVADFELKTEFRMPVPGFANSGIQYRSREEPKDWGKWVRSSSATSRQTVAACLRRVRSEEPSSRPCE